jgi:phenylpropionate dioxygenase-like ring-hydroxylating dioxygenase large terminal subunit
VPETPFGGERPIVSVQDVFDDDTVPPPPSLRRNGWVDLGTADVDRDRYYSADFHRLEVERMWRRVWQVACREEDIPMPGDHIVYDLADDSLLVIRGTDRIRAFYNSCPHRGTTLRDGPGRVARIVCPFHALTWSIEGELLNVPAAWDFAHVNDQFCLAEAAVATWGGFVFVNMSSDPEPLLQYLEVLPEEFSAHPLEDRYKAVHVRKIVPCNWKLALEAFAEALHVMRTHPQALPFTGDVNSQYDLWEGGRHVSRMISLLAVPSPQVRPPNDEAIIEALRPPNDRAERRPGTSPRQFVATRHRAHYERKYGTDLSAYSDAEILDAIQYHVFPNFSPWAGIGQPIQYLWRPNGNDPESSVMDVMYLAPPPANGERPPAAEVHVLDPDEPWTNARELGKYAPIFDQDQANFARLQKGVKAGRKGNTYARYQESKIRHFHQTLDSYLGIGREEGADPRGP